MRSEGMGITEINLGRLQEIAKNEGTCTFLQKVGASFYSDLNKELRKMKFQCEELFMHDVDQAELLTAKKRKIESVAREIVFRRHQKIMGMVLEASFHGTKPDLAQATQEELVFFTKTSKAVALLKSKGGM